MALSAELRAKIARQAKDIDEVSTDITARVSATVKNQQSAAIASRLDNPINSPSVQAKQSAQIASRLDNSLINKAMQGTTNPAEMYRPGNVTESLFKTPNYISNNAMTEMVDRANARWALQQDNTATEKAREAAKKSAEQQKAAMERMVSDLYQKMEGYKNNGQTDELFKAEQEYAKLNDSIAQMNSKIHGSAMEEAKDWETQRYNEIMSTGGRVLLANLERLAELSDNRIKEADDERRNGLTETETEYYDLYNNLKAKYGEQVDSWLEYAKRMGNKSQMAMSTAKARQAAEDKPFWASVGSVPLNMASGAGYLDVIGQNLQRSITGSDAPIDYNSPAQTASKMTGAIRGTVSEDMGKFGSFLYNTGMSMANTLAAMPMGSFGMAMLGGSAATNAMQTAIERGASDGQALKIGLAAGAMETVMEKLSIDNLFKLKTPEAAKDVVLNILKQAGAEGTEEGLTTLANTIADHIIMGDKSELNAAKRAYMAEGYSADKAEGMALKDWGLGLLTDIAGGALSGGVFGGVKSGAGYRRYKAVENAMPKLQPETQAQPPVADIAPTVQPKSAKPNLNQKWEKFFSKNNGSPSAMAFQNFSGSLNDADSTAFIAYLDAQEKAGNLKWRGDGTPVMTMPADDHIDNRDYGSVGDPKVKSFQYNNPELQPFMQEGLQILADDLDHTLPGERYYNGIDPNGVGSQGLWSGQKRHTSPEIAMLKDDFGMSYEAINKAMDDLAQDAGKENNANAKRLELVIDQILTHGHRTLGGTEFPPNQAYIEAKGKIAGAKPIQQTETEVEELPMMPGYGEVGDMGAKTSDFRHEVRESQTGSNTIAQSEEEANVPEEQRRTLYYDTMSEEESLHNARERLDMDYEGEMDALARAAVWSNEEVDMGMAILRDLQAEAAETGDWSAYRRWRETVKQHGVASGQGLQAWAKYTRRTGDRLVEEAADILEEADTNDANEIMGQISLFADEFDDADEGHFVDDLLAIIRRTSASRRTGSFFRNRLSRQMEWALERVAGYAREELASGGESENFNYLRDLAYNGILNMAEDQISPTVADGYLTIRRNAMLSKASTTMRNLVGNNVFDPLDSVAGNISVPLDALLSTFTGTRSVAFDRSWVSAEKRQGALDGLARAMLETGLDVHVAQEAGRYENTANRTFKMSGGVFSRLLSSWEKWMGYALNATDEFQKGGIEAETQRGIDRLYERGRIAADDDSLRNAGEQEALYRTFQDDTAIYRAVQGIREGLNQFHVGNLGVGDLAIPFARVPANLPARAMDYSPIGLARGVGRLGRVLYDAHNGNLTAAQQAQAVKDIGRGITGSGLIAAATALALKGVIHVVGPGGEEESKDKAASDKAKGLSGTQLNVSAMIRAAEGGSTEWQDGDTLMSIGFLDPINAQLTTGALIAEDIRSGEADAGTILQDSFTGTLQSLLDLPVMQTFQEVANAYQYSEGETSGEKMVDAGKQWLASEAVSTIPNSLKGIAQGMDEYQRDLYAKDDLLGQTIDQMIGSVPGMRDRLTAKQDVYGNDVKNPDQPLNFLNSNILPGAITTYTETDLMRVLDDLAEQTGSNAAYLSKNAPKTVTVGDETVALSKDQQRQFMTERGKVYEAASAAIQDSGKFQKLSKEMQLKVYEYAEKFATQAAKAALGIGYEIDTKWMREIASKSADWQAKAIIDRAIENAKK